MEPLYTLLLFTAAVTGAVFYRMRGGAPSWPRPIEQILFCTVFGAAMDAVGVPFWWQVAAVAAAVVFCMTGHGQYFLAMLVKAIEPERLDFLIRPLFGRDPRTADQYEKWRDFDPTLDPEEEGMTAANYQAAMKELDAEIRRYGRRKLFARCATGLAVTGLAVSIAPGLAVMMTTPHLWAGLALAASGALKAVPYMISHALGHGTEGGEYGNGGLQWFVAVLIAILVVT